MPHAILISFVIAVGAGIVYAVRQRTHAMQLSREVSKRLLKSNEYCGVCSKPFFTCSICGCQFDKEIDARRCYEWDVIMHRDHQHKYPHHHDEE